MRISHFGHVNTYLVGIDVSSQKLYLKIISSRKIYSKKKKEVGSGENDIYRYIIKFLGNIFRYKWVPEKWEDAGDNSFIREKSGEILREKSQILTIIN